MALVSTATWLVTSARPLPRTEPLLLGLVAVTASALTAWAQALDHSGVALCGLPVSRSRRRGASCLDGCVQHSLPQSPSLISALSRAKQHAEHDLGARSDARAAGLGERTEELTAANTALARWGGGRKKAERTVNFPRTPTTWCSRSTLTAPSRRSTRSARADRPHSAQRRPTGPRTWCRRSAGPVCPRHRSLKADHPPSPDARDTRY
jgi:hypothetical protein